MADEKLGGLLGLILRSEEDKGGGIMGLPYPTGGLLAMYEKKPQPVYRSVNGSDAVDRMLSSEDPSRRFRVYRRNLGTDKNGGTRGSSSSFAHWLFISEDGKHGFGFNQDGEEIELPDNLEGYELHPDFADKTFSAAGLINARRRREQSIADRYQYGEDNPWMFYDFGEMPDLHEYDGLRNNCQHYIDNIVKYYNE